MTGIFQTTGMSGNYVHRIQAFVASPGLHLNFLVSLGYVPECVWTVLAIHEMPASTRKRLI